MFSCSHCSCTIFALISYSLDIQVMLILILIDVQYSQKPVFTFAKGLNGQNHSSGHLLRFPPPSKKSPSKTSHSPTYHYLENAVKWGKMLYNVLDVHHTKHAFFLPRPDIIVSYWTYQMTCPTMPVKFITILQTDIIMPCMS